jgi:heme A synthase
VRAELRALVKAFRALTVIGAVLAYALATLGSWTRINAAGMTCPDWPLCRGAVVPVLQGGVVLEWLHRALALVVSLVVIAVIVAGLRVRERIPGLRPMLFALGAAIVAQVLLGGVTIFAANSPPSVMLHWAAAMLLLAALTSLAVVSFANAGGAASFGFRPGTWPLLIATAWAFAAMCAGAYVSSSGAGLACAGFPGCGETLFGQNGPQALQMTHRLLAAGFVVFALVAAVALPSSARRATVALRVGLVLLALQIALGILNVLFSLPPPLREAHAANAGATFLAFVVSTVLASLALSEERAARPADGRRGVATPAAR